jgi:hypothetical protein
MSSTSPATSLAERVAELTLHFQRQADFAQGYSPLYARLFRLLAGWLAGPEYRSDPLVLWLATAAEGRHSFSVPILLLAGLHRLVLSGVGNTAALSRYYPTAGAGAESEDALPAILRAAILEHQAALAHFIHTNDVQTNETSRGLAWLLPLHYCSWERVQLVDLGASAGLNLLADYRRYRLEDAAGRRLLDIGAGPSPQFLTICGGEMKTLPAPGPLPRIVQRLGCDLRPFSLDDAEQELTLMSFVWADHPERLQRLREGIAAYRLVQQSDVPTAPLVLFNTYMTVYLEDKGASMRRIIGAWAAEQNQPVLWLQWEPAYGGKAAPEYSWCAWTADLWEAGEHSHQQLAWVHPHGVEAQFEPGGLSWFNRRPRH